MGATKMTVTANYWGQGPLVLAVGTTSNIDASKVKEVSVAKGNGTIWTLVADGLAPGTAYWYRLRAWDSKDYTISYALPTLSRTVDVDFTTVYLVDDGDSWPNGCGDMIFEFMITAKPAATGEQQQWEKKRTAGETCLDSGEWYSVNAQAGHFHREHQPRCLHDRRHVRHGHGLGSGWRLLRGTGKTRPAATWPASSPQLTSSSACSRSAGTSGRPAAPMRTSGSRPRLWTTDDVEPAGATGVRLKRGEKHQLETEAQVADLVVSSLAT